MSHFTNTAFRKRRTLVNWVVLFALLLGLLPQSLAAASGATNIAAGAGAAGAQQTPACEAPGENMVARVLLPMITGFGQAFAATASTPQALAYEVGKTYTYKMNQAVQVASFTREGGSEAQKQVQESHAQSYADITILAQNAQGYVGEVTMREPWFCSTTEGQTIDNSADLAAALQVPLRFVQSPNGVVVAVEEAQTASPEALNMQKAVLSALQATLQSESAQYAANEVNLQGAYTAHYNVASRPGVLEVNRSTTHGDFSELVASADAFASLKMQENTRQVLDGARGVFSEVEQRQSLATGDGAGVNGAALEGTTSWMEVDSTSHLVLVGVNTAIAEPMAASAQVYTAGSLKAQIADNGEDDIDLATIDLDAEFAALEAAAAVAAASVADASVADASAEDATLEIDAGALVNHSIRIADWIARDPSGVVAAQVSERINANASNTVVGAAYVDVLGMAATAAAQAGLSSVLHSETVGSALQEQALLAAAGIQAPTMELADAVRAVAANVASPLQTYAISALGAVVSNSGDAALADEVAAEVEVTLASAGSFETVDAALAALGNIGAPRSQAVIAAYQGTEAAAISAQVLATDVLYAAESGEVAEVPTAEDIAATAEMIRSAALVALRKYSDPQIDENLATIAADANAPEGERAVAESILAERGNLENVESAAVDKTYSKTWGKWFGNSRLGIYLPGSATAATYAKYANLRFAARQDVDAYILGIKINAIAGQIDSWKASSKYQRFVATLIVGNNLLKPSYTTNRTCSSTYTKTLVSATRTFFSYKYRLPVYVFTIDFTAKATGTFRIDTTLKTNLCNPANISASAVVTPRSYVTASASAAANGYLVRGGIAVTATLFNSHMPTGVSASVKGATHKMCVDARLTSAALSGYVYGFGDYWKISWFKGKWSRVWERTFATFSLGAVNKYALLVKCY